MFDRSFYCRSYSSQNVRDGPARLRAGLNITLISSQCPTSTRPNTGMNEGDELFHYTEFVFVFVTDYGE
jgi:hypothetical protein